MSNFSFADSVFYPFRELSAIFVKFEAVVSKLFGKELTLYHGILIFNVLEKRSFMKLLWIKEKMLVTSIFSFAHKFFYPFQNEFYL